MCTCVSGLQARGREEGTLIEIPSAMSGRAMVSEWHTQPHTHAHIFTLALALIKVGFAIWRPCARLASLCFTVARACASAGEVCTYSTGDPKTQAYNIQHVNKYVEDPYINKKAMHTFTSLYHLRQHAHKGRSNLKVNRFLDLTCKI